jgi:hypothetical protein
MLEAPTRVARTRCSLQRLLAHPHRPRSLCQAACVLLLFALSREHRLQRRECRLLATGSNQLNTESLSLTRRFLVSSLRSPLHLSGSREGIPAGSQPALSFARTLAPFFSRIFTSSSCAHKGFKVRVRGIERTPHAQASAAADLGLHGSVVRLEKRVKRCAALLVRLEGRAQSLVEQEAGGVELAVPARRVDGQPASVERLAAGRSWVRLLRGAANGDEQLEQGHVPLHHDGTQ